jgi:hypothetical protein
MIKKNLSLMMISVGIISTVPAQAACWSEAAVEAAKVRDLETMLMVSSLRCHAASPALLDEYNGFVKTSRVALTEVNQTLRKQFADAGGLNAYDKFVTAIANRYGAGTDGLNCNDMASIVAAAQAEGGSLVGLTRLATDAGIEPQLSGPKCAVTMAAAR